MRSMNCAHLRFRQRADELVHQLAVDTAFTAGMPRTPICGGELLVLVGVDLGERELARVFGRQLLQDGLERTARRAPRRPEIDDDRRGLRAFEHDLAEVGGVDVDGMRAHAMPLRIQQE